VRNVSRYNFNIIFENYSFFDKNSLKTKVKNVTLMNISSEKVSQKVSLIFEFSKLLQSGDIEPNPGPKILTLDVKTYNARGLKNRLKLKRVLNSCHKIMSQNNNTLIFLQETHLENEDNKTVELMWRHNFLLSPGTNRQWGCITLFDPSWKVLYEYLDTNGRFIIVILEKYDRLFMTVNVYAPNDHNINFFADLFNRIIELQRDFPGTEIIFAGDFNLVLDDIDSVNRATTNSELQCRNFIKRNISRLDLKDSYRRAHIKGGFSWARGSCMSRLDLILVSSDLAESLTSSKVDWAFDDSDHAMVESNFKLITSFEKGPGLVRVNAEILDKESTLEQVKSDLNNLLEQIPEHWNPHMKLDFVKTSIRGVMSVISGKVKKIESIEQDAISEQINTLMATKEKLELGEINSPELKNSIDQALAVLEGERNDFLDRLSKRLSLRAQVKWYEEGERSNKYFLNIIKKRTEQQMITKLTSQNRAFETQKDIMEHVTNFYEKLYSYKETNDNCDNFLSDLPKLNVEDNRMLDQEITLEELKKVVDGCGDSAPGPDGISYKIYRKLWPIVGHFLLDAWKYSLSIGILPLDQRVSAITLLPKVGKNPEKIENWRPITLSNCDLKIFTKLISNRVSRVLEKLIHPSQTAYVPGRAVHDNLRMFNFYNDYCKTHNVDALLISLDAKKAFDSVSHKYLHKVLLAYGFSNEFIDTVKLLYNDIKANILVNGYKSVIIKILRSVKQGDALSCALFILCIDPLIRKIENNPEIKPVQIPRSGLTGIQISNKIGGFADDIGVAINNDERSIHNVFTDYDLFSSLSGIELNLDKTEVLKMNCNTLHEDHVPQEIMIKGERVLTVESLSICGVSFSNNVNIAYENNILDKIFRMERQLIMWLQRPLSMEGKILIVKVFGMSQLIYILQMCEISPSEIADIERMIFKFLWNKRWVGTIAPDRIKRSILKLPYEKGGLQVPDVAIMDKALKVKQFIRAMSTNHPINLIQKFLLEKVGYDDYYKIEYAKLCKSDIVIRTYQLTCNFLTDQFRSECSNLPLPDPDGLINPISVVASTEVLEYLMRKKELMLINRYGALANVGICTLRQLYNESIYPRNDNLGNLAKYIISFLPHGWKVALGTGIGVNAEVTYENEFPSLDNQFCMPSQVTVKLLRKLLSERELVPIYPFMDYVKFQIAEPGDNLTPFRVIRKNIKVPRDKFFKYRILMGDVFCKSRMFKFKMVNSALCDFCNNQHIVEDIKHMLWDCPRAQILWVYLKNLIGQSYGVDYISYKTIVVGQEATISVVETLIILTLKLIMVKERSTEVTVEQLENKIKAQYFIEKCSLKQQNFQNRWGSMEQLLFGHVD
jgi:exonuclease III